MAGGYLLIQADARQIPLADNSVDCVVTSPPYWGLRDYGVAGQLGLEPLHDCLGWATGKPCGECWVCQMLAVFHEVRRVLKPTGTCWVNLGDSYSDGGHGTTTFRRDRARVLPAGRWKSNTLRPKNLVGIPWRFALALQADGWWLRSEIVWAKPNPMPESIKDRPTKAHEQVFLFAKRPHYYYDQEAVREPAAGKNLHDLTGPGYSAPGQSPHTGTRRSKVPDGWDRGDGAHGTIHRAGRSKGAPAEIRLGRALRSVWTIPPQPTPEAHFATFPEALAERCILAGCPDGGVVMDPFVGSGTTCRVAERLGRRGVGLDLNMDYLAEIAAPRCARPVQPSLAGVA